jgi:hypothetical protein
MRFGALLFAGVAALGCGNTSKSESETVGRTRGAVESSGLGVFYGLAFEPAPSLATVIAENAGRSAEEQLDLFARGLAAQGEPAWPSGAITIPALDSVGAPLFAPAPATNRIRFTCGATLVSPSYLITAGHCVTPDSDLGAIKLRLYRPTPALAASYVPALLSGAFPSYTHPRLSASDGYLFDEYSCTVENRCFWESNSACPASGTNGDLALLRCDGRPGDKYGFLNLNQGGAPGGKEALMHWKHELLDLGAPESELPQDRVDHYVVRDDVNVEQNYHYFDEAADLLPLRSIDWQSGNPTGWVTDAWTDLHGCHGTSGSGLLVRVGDTLLYELVGPVGSGSGSLAGRLCQRVPNPGGTESGEGRYAMGVDGPDPRVLVALHAAEFEADCRTRGTPERDVLGLAFSPGSYAVATLFQHLTCQLDDFGTSGSVAADPSFGPYPERFVETPGGTRHEIGGFSLEAGADYRAGAQVMPGAACADDCGSVTFEAGTQTFMAAPHAIEPSLLAVAFAAPAAGPANLALANTGQTRALGGIVLIREGQVNSFDTIEDRLEAALYALDANGGVRVGPLPMRISGDGSAGFQALLMPGERLALLRQALVPGRRWTVRLGSPSYGDLSCGLLDRTGAPLAATACGEVFRLDDREGAEARLGVYVELAGASTRPNAEIRYVAVASDAARDDDEDGVPEVLDNCPNDWNAAQGACSEEPPDEPEGGGGEGGEGGVNGDAGGGGERTEVAGEGGEGGEGTENPSAGNGNGGSAGVSGSASGGTSGATSGGGGVSGANAGTAGEPGLSGNSGRAGSGNDAGGSGASGPGGVSTSQEDSGCACRAARNERSSAPLWLTFALAFVFARRRSRRP